jgi:cell shape-determining protein MreC
MAGTRKRPFQSNQLFIWLTVISLVFILLPQRLTESLDHLLAWAVSPLSNGGRGVTLTVTEQFQQNSPETVSRQEYQEATDRIRQLENKIVNLAQELRYQQECNSKLYGFNEQLQLARANYIPADVIASGTGNLHREVYLNRGSGDGVKAGQIVLGVYETGDKSQLDVYQMSVVGKIQSVELQTAKLQLLNDSGFSLSAFIEPHVDREQQWRVEGMVQGGGMGNILVKHIEIKGNDVQAGDAVLAHSDPERLPIETILGKVASCRMDDNNVVLWHIEVEPTIALHNLKEVVILAIP